LVADDDDLVALAGRDGMRGGWATGLVATVMHRAFQVVGVVTDHVADPDPTLTARTKSFAASQEGS